ncbi:MAG TPA: hypothetical protein VFC42_17255 [Methylomirabilota bacterium]|nr:hypothetical protein [Methylomirabilota bacterium]
MVVPLTGSDRGPGPSGAAAGPAAPARIRRAASAADWEAVRTLCCLTGDAGDPVDAARWPLFAELWIGPYQRLAPAWTYVADVGDRIAGYLTGCPDTRAFERARRWHVTLPLLLRLALGRYRWNADARRFARRALGLRRPAEARLAEARAARLLDRYPAHLHMNVGAASRGRGIGAALLTRFLGDLVSTGIGGVHLLCGPGPRAFYLRAGFAELGALEARPGRVVYLLGRTATD